MDPEQTWSTRRLDAEPVQERHAEPMYAVLADPLLHAFTGGSPLGRDELAARYRRLAATRRSPDGTQVWATWVLRERETTASVGYLEASYPVDGPHAGPALVAWVVGTAAQGRGLASEAATELVARLTAEGFRVVADVHPDHLASQRVAAHAGLAPTAETVQGETRWARRPAAGQEHAAWSFSPPARSGEPPHPRGR